jgi:hypothetical protein
MGAAPGVTSCRVHTWQVRSGSAVRDIGREGGRCGAAARAGGDAGAREQVAVPGQPAVRAGKHPPGGLGDGSEASGAGGGGAPLVGQPHGDPGRLGFVVQGAEQVADPPGAGALVVPPARLDGEHAAGVAHRQSPGLVLYGPADNGPGSLVLGLPDPAAVPGLHQTLAAPELAPPP